MPDNQEENKAGIAECTSSQEKLVSALLSNKFLEARIQEISTLVHKNDEKHTQAYVSLQKLISDNDKKHTESIESLRVESNGHYRALSVQINTVNNSVVMLTKTLKPYLDRASRVKGFVYKWSPLIAFLSIIGWAITIVAADKIGLFFDIAIKLL
jgi:uncharacterized membrane protein YcgQ (UPF0703/DUF1980 family)